MGESGITKQKAQEIRTPHGIRLGDRVKRGNCAILHLKVGKSEDYISPEELVEAVVGKPVDRIIYREQARSANLISQPAAIQAVAAAPPT